MFGACVSDPCQLQPATDYSRVASMVDITKSGILQGLYYIFFIFLYFCSYGVWNHFNLVVLWANWGDVFMMSKCHF